MADQIDMIGLTKAVQWELAKGHLRAVVQASGQISYNQNRGCGGDWQELSKRVEAFIEDVEGAGLQE